ncbi:MAG: hypothetical protein E7L17_00510 [Clostridium sp.]|uniref:hypothetical protein n=1 Tax=Clostridium sp. TaxID=1506 RepID=UPI00290A6883|nr:hypothetical protein [Clostridium sp.]MDU7336577.1 hypothetical protein [Clostridium sp.]
MSDWYGSYLGEIEAPNMITTLSLEVLFNIATALRIPPSRLLEFKDWLVHIK